MSQLIKQFIFVDQSHEKNSGFNIFDMLGKCVLYLIEIYLFMVYPSDPTFIPLYLWVWNKSYKLACY